MSYKISFGTDGWRAIIAQDFTTENVARVSEAVVHWLKAGKINNPSIVLGHDCRFGGPLFLQTAVNVFSAHGIKVLAAEGVVSTPMVSLGTLHYKASLGIIITASHNPPSYNGYKIKGSFGGPLAPEHIQEIEGFIPESCSVDYTLKPKNAPEFVNLEELYLNRVRNAFDIASIHQGPFRFAYDAMYGAGMGVMAKLFPDIPRLHSTYNPGFEGQAPEPIHKNLHVFSNFIKAEKTINCGLATDGDADRIGVVSEKGEILWGDELMIVFSRAVLKNKPGATIISEVKSSHRLYNDIEKNGGKGIMWKTGHSLIKAKMKETGSPLAGEMSGHIFFKHRWYGFDHSRKQQRPCEQGVRGQHRGVWCVVSHARQVRSPAD